MKGILGVLRGELPKDTHVKAKRGRIVISGSGQWMEMPFSEEVRDPRAFAKLVNKKWHDVIGGEA